MVFCLELIRTYVCPYCTYDLWPFEFMSNKLGWETVWHLFSMGERATVLITAHLEQVHSLFVFWIGDSYTEMCLNLLQHGVSHSGRILLSVILFPNSSRSTHKTQNPSWAPLFGEICLAPTCPVLQNLPHRTSSEFLFRLLISYDFANSCYARMQISWGQLWHYFSILRSSPMPGP